MKLTTVLKHNIYGTMELALHGKVDFSKKRDNSVFGISLGVVFA